MFACMSICTPYEFPEKPEENFGKPGTGVSDGCEPLYGIKLGYSGRAVSELNYKAISPVTKNDLIKANDPIHDKI